MAKRMKVVKEERPITFLEAVEDFLERKTADGLSRKSITDYEYGLDKFIKFFDIDDSFLLTDLEEKMLYKYKASLQKFDMSYRTVNSYITVVRVFIRWCEKMYNLPHYELTDIKGQEKKIKYYTEEEMEVLLQKPIDNNNFGAWRMWAIISFIYATGARAQSVCDLEQTDINYYKREITFTHQKNKSLLVLPLSDALERVLKEYIRKCNLADEKILFPSITGDKMNPVSLNKSMVIYCKNRGVENKGIHALRHTFASQAIRNGMNPVKLQKTLNHKKFSMTENYLHLFGDDLKVDYDDYSPLDVAMRKRSRTKRVGK